MDLRLRKFDIQLSKLQNGKIKFKYDIETAQPLCLKIKIQESQIEGNGNGENGEMSQCNSSTGTSWSGFQIHGSPGRSYTFSITVAESYYGFSVKDWQKTMACSPHGYQYLSQEVLRARMVRASNFYHFGTPTDHPGLFVEFYSLHATAVEFFKRAKPASHWASLMGNNGIMSGSIRHATQGHPSGLNYSFPGSGLNYSFPGIYFFAVPSFIQSSPFGDEMIYFPPSLVLGHNPLNDYCFYFADIKCYVNRNAPPPIHAHPYQWQMPQGKHFVTIAICRNGSDEQRYCDEHLIKLSPVENPFFVLGLGPNRNWQIKVYTHNRVWIELFFMDRLHVDLNNLQRRPVERMNSTKVVNKNCQICNIGNLHLNPVVNYHYPQTNYAMFMGQMPATVPLPVPVTMPMPYAPAPYLNWNG